MPTSTGSNASGESTQADRAGATALGVVLIVLGGVFLFAMMLGSTWAQAGWPLFVILPGLGLFAASVLGGKSWSALAVPASIVTVVGIVLWVQNAFNLWQTWAYAWALIFPTAAGVGLWLHGTLIGNPGLQQQGRNMLIIGAVLVVVFGAFFEGLLNLSGMTSSIAIRFALPAVLIGIGVWLVVIRRPLTHG